MERIFWFIAAVDLIGIGFVLWVKWLMNRDYGLPSINPDSIPAMPECKPPKTERPKFLKGPAKREWERLAPLLYEKGVLTTWDMATFAQYCWHWGEWYSLGQAIKKANGATKASEGKKLDLLVHMQLKVLAACRSLATELGMTMNDHE